MYDINLSDLNLQLQRNFINIIIYLQFWCKFNINYKQLHKLRNESWVLLIVPETKHANKNTFLRHKRFLFSTIGSSQIRRICGVPWLNLGQTGPLVETESVFVRRYTYTQKWRNIALRIALKMRVVSLSVGKCVSVSAFVFVRRHLGRSSSSLKSTLIWLIFIIIIVSNIWITRYELYICYQYWVVFKLNTLRVWWVNGYERKQFHLV